MRFKLIGMFLAMIMSMMLMVSCGSSDASETMPDKGESQKVQEQQTSEKEQTANEPSDIGAEKVKQIVLAKVPGAVEGNIYEFEKEYDNGRLEYEGSLYYDGYEYEFEVDGATGNILQWEIDD